MKKMTMWLFILGFVFMGCETKAGTGALAGGAVGAAAGGAMGGGKGVLIGGAVGAATGGIIGAGLDEQDRKIMKKTSPRTVDRMDHGEPLTINDIIKLSQGGISDDTTIKYINNTGTSYNLNQTQIRRLQRAGVSQRVINYMIDTGR